MSADLVLQDLTPDMLPLHPGLFDGHCFETSLIKTFPGFLYLKEICARLDPILG